MVSPFFFSEIKASEFISIPIKTASNEANADQCSSFLDYSESKFKTAQERQRDILFKYQDKNQWIEEEEEESKENSNFLQKRKSSR